MQKGSGVQLVMKPRAKITPDDWLSSGTRTSTFICTHAKSWGASISDAMGCPFRFVVCVFSDKRPQKTSADNEYQKSGRFFGYIILKEINDASPTIVARSCAYCQLE